MSRYAWTSYIKVSTKLGAVWYSKILIENMHDKMREKLPSLAQLTCSNNRWRKLIDRDRSIYKYYIRISNCYDCYRVEQFLLVSWNGPKFSSVHEGFKKCR